MKAFLIIVLVVTFGKCGNSPAPPPLPAPTPQPAASVPDAVATATPAPPSIAQPCASEGDVTPAIYESMAKGQTHSGGGCIRSWLTVEGALKLGAGIYQVVNPILTKSHSSIISPSWDTIILESSEPQQWTVISAYNHAHQNGDTDSDITLKGFKIAGANGEFWSTAQAVSLGNCVGCTVDGLWLDGTHSIGVQLGGGSTVYKPEGPQHYYAKDSKVTNCLFTHVASQQVAVVNGENIEISGNKFLGPGQAGGPGNTSIDLETNGPDDRLVNIKVVNNFIDHRGSQMPTTGNGIVVQAIGKNVGNILVDSNTLIGGNLDPPANVMSNGIFVFGPYMKDVTVTHNKITRTGQTGIWLQGSNIVCEDNALDSVGGGGTEGFRATVSNSRIQRNTFICASGICDNSMIISGTGNTVENNAGWVVK